MSNGNTVDIRGRMNFGGLVVDWRIDEDGTFKIPTGGPAQALMMVQNIASKLDQAGIATANAPALTQTPPPAPQATTITYTPAPVSEPRKRGPKKASLPVAKKAAGNTLPLPPVAAPASEPKRRGPKPGARKAKAEAAAA